MIDSSYAFHAPHTITLFRPPMANEQIGIRNDSMKKVTAQYNIQGNGKKTGWFLIPHEKYFEDLDRLTQLDFEAETAAALTEWEDLLFKGARIEIADEMLMHCYNACLCDLFVMRERIGSYTGITCGTHSYRAANSGEPLETEMLLDTLGYTEEAAQDYRMYLDGQEKDGNWATAKGWEHESWGACFNKANAVMTHYRLTGNRAFLERYYQNMYASTMFNHKARQSTKHAKREFERGLMPRGMGDCGMMNGKDYYGVFFPPNCQAVAADGLTLEAARILGRTEDIAALTEIYAEARRDLLRAMRNNLANIDGLKVIPSIAGSTTSSIYGCLYSFFPCGLIQADDPMLTDTVKYIESKQISPGGLPMGTGWMKDGLWVAMALSNIARAYLRMEKYDLARKYLYPALNHASPFVTWCEERGAEKNSSKISGDRQHLWTPLSVGQYITEALFFEDGKNIHVFAGILPHWLSEHKTLSVSGLCTPYGKTHITAQNSNGCITFHIQTQQEMKSDLILHLPTPEGTFATRTLDASGRKELFAAF